MAGNRLQFLSKPQKRNFLHFALVKRIKHVEDEEEEEEEPIAQALAPTLSW